MEDKLIKDLMVSIAFIAKIVIGIVWKVKGIFTPGIGWVILFIAAAIFVPMGVTICFIICKSPLDLVGDRFSRNPMLSTK